VGDHDGAINSKDEKKLIEALNRMREDFAEQRRKNELAMWTV
jgi:hypothetical protein